VPYVIVPNHPFPTHTEISTGIACLVREVSDGVLVMGTGSLRSSLDGFVEIEGAVKHPLVPVPGKIANWRAKAVLGMAGLLSSVEAALNAMAEPARTVALAAWNGGADLARNGPTVLALAQVLGLNDDQVDDMFRQAAALEV
jgi:hypothetical protein